MSTTRWKDTKTPDLDTAIDLLTREVANDTPPANLIWKNWSLTKAFQENQNIVLNGQEITFNVIKYSFDQATLTDAEERIVKKDGFIIAYFNGISVNYIINQNSIALKLLRKLLSYTGRNELEKNSYTFSNNFFVWLINRVYNSNNVIESNNNNLQDLSLDYIKGFKGDTEDSQTTVTANGEAVMNIISTLSFLLESKRLDQIKLNLSYANHETINVILKNGVITSDLMSYQGCFENDENNLLTAKLYLLIYIEILTILEQEFLSDIENGLWNREEYINFMNSVATNLTEKVQAKITSLNE